MGEAEGRHAAETNLLDRHLLQVCDKARFLELVHDFIVFDAGIKKVCRQNQYFGVKAAQDFRAAARGHHLAHPGQRQGLTWSGWPSGYARTDRASGAHHHRPHRTLMNRSRRCSWGVHEQIYRSKSGADLIDKLNGIEEPLLCSLVNKFGRAPVMLTTTVEKEPKDFIAAPAKPAADPQAKGEIYVFVDECHRTQSGDLHQVTKAPPRSAVFIGFTGTPC